MSGAASVAWAKANREKARAIYKRWYEKNKEKALSFARKWKRGNKDKVKASTKKWIEENRERFLEKSKERIKRFHKLHPERKKKYEKEYSAKNPQLKRARKATRRAIEKMAVPKWADDKKIKEIYAIAVRLERETGVKHHVDHIIPLNNPLVCGLHCEDNLQAIPWMDNLKKANKMVDAQAGGRG